jgi:regulator of sigma E protease
MLSQPPIWLIVVAFICALGPLVFFHELGHYLVGRAFGVGAETFSIGFGREVVGWTDKRGTRWKVGWLPLGGFVRFVGDMNPASMPAADDGAPRDPKSPNFHHKPVWQRFLIVLAGPAANFLLAILIFAGFFATAGMPQTPNVAQSVIAQGAAHEAGIRAGDRIVSIAGRATPTFEDIFQVVMLRPGERVEVVVDRGGRQLGLPVTIKTEEQRDRFGQTFRIGRLGVYGAGREYVRPPVAELLPSAAAYTFSLTRSMIDGLVQIVTGRRSTKELGGPLKIAQIAGQQATLGFFEFVQLVAFFSINLGFINLLPVPMLDGGHLVFYAVEAVRRRPVSPEAIEWAFRGGLALLLALVVFTTFNDLDSFGLWDRLGRLIG